MNAVRVGEAPPWRGTWRRCALEPLASGRLSRSIPARAGNPAPGTGPGPRPDSTRAGAREATAPDAGLRRRSGRAPRPGPGACRVVRAAAGRGPTSRSSRGAGAPPPPASTAVRPSVPPGRAPAHCPGAAGGVKAEAGTVRPHGTFSGRTGRFSEHTGRFPDAWDVFRRPVHAWKRPVRRRDFRERFEPPRTGRFPVQHGTFSENVPCLPALEFPRPGRPAGAEEPCLTEESRSGPCGPEVRIIFDYVKFDASTRVNRTRPIGFINASAGARCGAGLRPAPGRPPATEMDAQTSRRRRPGRQALRQSSSSLRRRSSSSRATW